MFHFRKDKDKPKLSRAEKKAQKYDQKKAKLLAKGNEKKDVSKKIRKHVTSLPFVGSRVLQSFAGFAAAGAFYQYEVMHSYMLTGIFGGATLAISLVSAAPYMKSVARTNSTLATVVADLDKIDAAVGSQSQLVTQIVSDVEKVLQAKGYAPEAIRQIHQKLDGIQKSLDSQKAQASAQPKAEVHTAPQNSKKNIIAE